MYSGSVIPTVCLRTDLRDAVCERFPDCEAGKRDAEFLSGDMSAHTVSWYELRNANSPAPSKKCNACSSGKEMRPESY